MDLGQVDNHVASLYHHASFRGDRHLRNLAILPMHIVFLADYSQYVPTVAAWVYHQWLSHEPGSSLEQVAATFHTHRQRNAIPLTLLVLDAEQTVVGTASIYHQDMSTRPHLSPWLAAVYVLPAYRGQGIGTRLVEAIEIVASKLGIARLYLFTPDRMTFYARLGWEPLERSEYRNEPVVIMTKALAPDMTDTLCLSDDAI